MALICKLGLCYLMLLFLLIFLGNKGTLSLSTLTNMLIIYIQRIDGEYANTQIKRGTKNLDHSFYVSVEILFSFLFYLHHGQIDRIRLERAG